MFAQHHQKALLHLRPFSHCHERGSRMDSLFSRVFATLALLISLVNTSFASIDVDVLGQADGSVLIRVSGQGEDANGSPDGEFLNIGWDNLSGNPFFTPPPPQRIRVPLPAPISFAPGVSIIAVILDDDPGTTNVDDFAIEWNTAFDYDDPFDFQGEVVIPGLNFAILIPGQYTAVNALGPLNLNIQAVPVPAAAVLFLGALPFLRRRC